MIFECPKCSTAHSRPEREVGSGTTVVCRNCSTPFRVSGTGTPLPAEGMAASLTGLDVDVPLPADLVAAREQAAAQLSSHTSPTQIREDLAATRNWLEAAKEPGADARSAGAGIDELGGEPAVSEPLDVAKAVAPPPGLEPVAGGVTPAAEPSAVPAALGKALPLDDERPVPRTAQSFEPPRVPGRVTLPRFPSGAVATYVADLWRWLMAQQAAVKVTVLSVLVVSMVVIVIGLVALASPSVEIVFADEKTPLMAGPGIEPAYAKLADLMRGDELAAYDRVGEWVMVRDLMGRAGFVQAPSLSDYQPVTLPGVAFAGCVHSPLEAGIEPCQARAQTQLESCLSVCDEDTDPATCSDHCQTQFLACVLGCEGAKARVGGSDELAEPPRVPMEAPAKKRKKRKRKRWRRR